MKLLSLFVLSLAAFGQSATMAPIATPVPQAAPVATQPTPSVATASLPAYTVGAGPAWTRGGTTPFALDVTIGIHIGQGQWYSWTDISTPVATPCVQGVPGCAPTSSLPVPSSITTGGAWVPIQSSSGNVSLIFVITAGFSSIQATSTVAPAFTGSFGIAFRLGSSHVYVMPYIKIANASTSASSGALATGVAQPGVQFLYGFGGK